MNIKILKSAALFSLIFLEGFKDGVVHAAPVPVHADENSSDSEPQNPVTAEPGTNPSEGESNGDAGTSENIEVDCSGYTNNSADECGQGIPVSCRYKVCGQ